MAVASSEPEAEPAPVAVDLTGPDPAALAARAASSQNTAEYGTNNTKREVTGGDKSAEGVLAKKSFEELYGI
jgi:hypothetical protein